MTNIEIRALAQTLYTWREHQLNVHNPFNRTALDDAVYRYAADATNELVDNLINTLTNTNPSFSPDRFREAVLYGSPYPLRQSRSHS